MDIQIGTFCEIIGNKLNREWCNTNELNKPNKPNKLTLSCLYALNIFNEEDLVYWRTAHILDNLINKMVNPFSDNVITPKLESDTISTLMSAIYCILASNQTIYGLPSMLDLRWRNGKITPHILFGEALANLVAITLIAESHKLLLTVETKFNKNKLINLFNSQLSEFRGKSEVIKNFTSIDRGMLAKDYQESNVILLINTINAILYLYGVPVDLLTKHKEMLKHIAREISNKPTIDNHEIEEIISNTNLISKFI